MIDVLYIEDEMSLALIVADSLEAHGFRVSHKGNGRDAVIAFKHKKPDIVVLDVMMPLMDGFTVAQEIRKVDISTPILFLTAMTQTEDVVKGFHLGANDYVRKPFKIEELIVRIEALTKKVGTAQALKQYAIGNYVLDTVKSTLCFNDVQEKLSFREVELLRRLFEHQDEVVPREEIIRAYWNDDTYFTGRSLDVFISRIRKYLAKDERIKITNIRSIGYMLTID
ncbi:response regulator transcription factor [Sphingobacterium oryzagri]|uniref:Response regulator transcription factor n=1 Tax=Sphingobacterium oryzagri TaxID=3025669 RepID=A0ABY7WJX5_9SPHI|nr:response regulator transcription factor [Sphingobacterium sp. KACC 22765]WDF68904.1 response regulator transcription factor [Sphingobacterium sp. KACC 22765]